MKNKILTILSIIIFLICALTVNVFAAITSASFKLTPSKENYEVGEEVTITIRLDTLVANRGIISYGALLEYDRDALEYVSCSGIGNWTAPFYNNDNGKLTADRNLDVSGLEGEDLCTFKFKAKKEKENVIFKLSDITLSNGGNAPGRASDIQTSINIKNTNPKPSNPSDEENTTDDDNTIVDDNTISGEDNTTSEDNTVSGGDNDNTTSDNNNNDNNDNNTVIVGGNTNNNSKPSNNNQNNQNDSNDLSTTAKTKFPQLGANDYLYASIFAIAVLTIVWFAKLKIVNKKIKKQVNYLVADEMKKELEK